MDLMLFAWKFSSLLNVIPEITLEISPISLSLKIFSSKILVLVEWIHVVHSKIYLFFYLAKAINSYNSLVSVTPTKGFSTNTCLSDSKA